MVTPSTERPKEDITLSDGSTTISLILSDAQGKHTLEGLRKNPYPRTSLKTASGNTQYADLEPPYFQRAQTDWSGGRGQETFEDDTSRYFDAQQADTTKSGQVILGPQVTISKHDSYTIDINQVDRAPNVTTYKWEALTGTQRYIGTSFSASASYTAERIGVHIRKVGTPNGALHVALYNDSAGDPTTERAGEDIEVASVDDITSRFYEITLSPTTALTGSTTYHVVVNAASASDDADNHWEVLLSESGTCDQSSDGSSWSTLSGRLFYVVCNNFGYYRRFMFQYKGSWYTVSQPHDGTNPKIYLNGDRGVADSNSGDKEYLEDGTKSWTTNEWLNAYVVITAGPGVEESQPWRQIVGNDADSLRVSPDWNTTHTTDTEYVIVGTDIWQEITGHGLTAPVTDVKVGGDFVYFAMGETSDVNVRRMQEYNNSGTWTRRYATEDYNAQHLEVVEKSGGGLQLWGTRNDHPYYGVCTWAADIPRLWGGLDEHLITISDTQSPWDEQAISNVTQSSANRATVITVGAAFTTGVIASEVVSADITKCKQIAFQIRSDVAVGAGELQLMLDDTAALASPVHTIDLPALSANEWTWVELDVSPLATAGSDAIISIGLNLTADLGAQVITLFGGILGVRQAQFVKVGDADDLANNIIAYPDADNDNRATPYVLKAGSLYRVLNGVAQEIPLDEFGTVADSRNGAAAAVSGVYLFLSFGNTGLERYFSRTLEDVGPNRDAGLPTNRQGAIVAIEPFPGRQIIGIDGGTDGYSSVMERRGEGWHELWRAPHIGSFGDTNEWRLYDIGAQSLPGDEVTWLWISLGRYVIHLPLSLNPYNDENYRYIQEGHVSTSWMYAGLQDVPKIFESFTIFAERLSSTNGQTVKVEYQVDDDPDNLPFAQSWTAISGTFDTSPSEEIDLSSTHDVTGKRIRFRIRLMTLDNSKTPRVVAALLKMVAVQEVKYQFPILFVVKDLDTDLFGASKDSEENMLAEVGAILQGWVNSATALLMRSRFYEMDNRYVKLDQLNWQPLMDSASENYEAGLYQAVLIDL